MLDGLKWFINKSVNCLGYKIQATADPVIDQDKRFARIYSMVSRFSMYSKERMYELYKSVVYVIENKISGDFVECGVWRGACVMLIAYTLLELKSTNRKLYLYDTFKGMTQAEKIDYKLGNKKCNAAGKWGKEQQDGYNKWCFAPLSEVKKNMALTGYPEEKIIFVRGMVESTIPGTVPGKICILKLNTTWYASTKHELTHLFPILSEKGILFVDDYGLWAGSKRALDEYFCNKCILLNRVDGWGRIAIKV
jgi:O-methyltransferase